MSDSFGKSLRAAREQRELSQQQLAQAAGLDLEVVALYERGESTPRLEVLGALGRGLGMSVTELLEWYVPAGVRSLESEAGGGGAG